AGRHPDAQEGYRHALGHGPTYAIALSSRGVALYHAGAVDDALASFERATAANAAFAKARLNQALLLYRERRLQLALETYRVVLGTDAEQPVAWNGIGLVLVDLRRFEDARAAFARA